MVKAIDNIKAWAKENVQLITILPENKNLQVDTRLKNVLENSVDEKYYLSDEKTALLIAQLEEKDKVTGTIGHHPFSKKFEFSGYNSEISPTLLATDYKAPKTVLEEGLLIREATKQGYALAVEGDAVNFQFPNSQTRRGRVGKQIANTLESSGVNQGVVIKEQCGVEYSRKTGVGKSLEVAHCLSASDWRGLNRNQAQTAVIEVKGCSTRTRSYAGQEEKLEIRKDFVSNSITTVPKDSMVLNAEIYEQSPIMLGHINLKGHDAINRVYDPSAVGPTLTTMGGGHREPKIAEVQADTPRYRIRKLTPLECFRLQSFPDWAFDKAAKVNSNSQLYKQAGNSVTVNVVREIAKRLN